MVMTKKERKKLIYIPSSIIYAYLVNDQLLNASPGVLLALSDMLSEFSLTVHRAVQGLTSAYPVNSFSQSQ